MKDPDVKPTYSTSFISFRDYVQLFIIMLAVTSSCAYVLLQYIKTGRDDSFILPLALFGNLMVTNLVALIILTFSKKINYGRPMQYIAEAARRITEGDFTARVQSSGRNSPMEPLINDFNKMAQELASIETMKSDFVANVSHEIKTPLNTIQSYAAALKNPKLFPEVQEEYVDIIISASQRLSSLVTNILKLNKLENQEILPLPETFDLSEQLRYCALAFEELWERKDINFEYESDLEEVMICTDPSLLEIVWNNLISNALKFTDRGGNIKIILEKHEKSLWVSVRDTGCGMDEETKRHIFDKFYQGDTSHSGEGNGLGLAMVKRVIDKIGGNITVDTQPGAGTTFTVILRLNRIP